MAVIGVTDATYREWAERGRFVTLDGSEVTDARTLAGQVGLAKAAHEYGLRRVISFHSRVKRAREFSVVHPRGRGLDARPASAPEGELWSGYVSGEMSRGLSTGPTRAAPGAR